MEASSAVLQRFPVTAGDRRLCGRRTRRVLGGGFTDSGTMKYYVSCGAKKKEEKKRAKLVKRLEKDLSAFYSMSSVVEPGVGLNEEAKSKMISEDAANLLLTKLKELRAEEKQMKRRTPKEESSSSSSSESSDSECETTVKMSKLKRVGPVNTEPKRTLEGMQQRSMIEVCMGGKCKKSGALEVMEEFEKKVVGIEGAVVGCKCMGKCRDGPNVRLVSHSNTEDDPVRPLGNPLCLGVGLEDVNTIVTNFLGEKDVNLLAA